MKKALSLLLSALLIFGCMTCMFTVPAAAASEIDWESPVNWVSFESDEGVAVNGPAVKINNPVSQAIYGRVNLKANTQYNFSMYTKNLAYTGYGQFTVVSSLGSNELDFAKLGTEWTNYKVTNQDPPHVADGATVAYNTYYMNLPNTTVAGADDENWQKLSFSFTTRAATEYLIIFNAMNLVDATKDVVYFSDVEFEEVINWSSPTGWATITADSSVAPAVSGTTLKLKAQYQAIHTRLNLVPNSDYTLTMYAKGIVFDGQYKQFSIVSSFGNDATDFAKLSGEWTEYKLAEHVADGAVVAYNSYFTDLPRTAFTGNDGSTWTKITIPFKTSAASQYIIVMNGLPPENEASPALYMSNFSITKNIVMSATADGNGIANVSNANPKEGEQVSFSASPYAGIRFAGWYNGDTLVSNDLVYFVNAESSLSLTAKFEGELLTWNGSSSNTVEAATVAPYNAGPVYKMGTWTSSMSYYTEVELKPATTYALTLYTRGYCRVVPSVDYTYVVPAESGYANCTSAGTRPGWSKYVPNNGYSNLITYINTEDFVNTNTYQETTIEFTTTESGKYIIALYAEQAHSSVTDDFGQNSFYMSDAHLTEIVYPVADVAESSTAIGTSLRKEGESANGQAIRYKYDFDKAFFSTVADGFKPVEVGFNVAATAALEGFADFPVLNAASYKTAKGVGYKADYDGNVSTNVVFAEDDTTVTYVVALYNISDYSKAYTVVPYVVFENADGDQIVRYGATQKACIFDVAKAILQGDNAEDIAYVNDTLLAGDQKAAYDEWNK